MQMWREFLNLLLGSNDVRYFKRYGKKDKLNRRQLIQRESELGGQIFGDTPPGVYRQFFNLDANTWIWYEEIDNNGAISSTTTRYEIRGNKILKMTDGETYYYIHGEELQNLMHAIHVYYEKVARDVYNRDPATGQLIAA